MINESQSSHNHLSHNFWSSHEDLIQYQSNDSHPHIGGHVGPPNHVSY